MIDLGSQQNCEGVRVGAGAEGPEEERQGENTAQKEPLCWSAGWRCAFAQWSPLEWQMEVSLQPSKSSGYSSDCLCCRLPPTLPTPLVRAPSGGGFGVYA